MPFQHDALYFSFLLLHLPCPHMASCAEVTMTGLLSELGSVSSFFDAALTLGRLLFFFCLLLSFSPLPFCLLANVQMACADSTVMTDTADL